jgi:hypothetical protein
MAIETQDHVILCNTNESRKAYKINLIKDISKMMINNNTHDDLQRVICACLNAYIHGREIPTMNELADNPSDLLVQAYIDQEAIGWDNFLRGRMTKKWGEIYSRSNVTQNHETRKVKSKKWGKDLVVYCWKFFLSTWTERNQIEHGSASKEETNARVWCKLIAKIKWLHSKVKERVTEFGDTIEIEELEKIPLANLEIMEVQMSKIKLSQKLDHLRGGQGDSQDSDLQDVGH